MLHSFLLVIAISVDSFLAALAYGTKKIKIPFISALLISSIGVLFLFISLISATFIQAFLSAKTCTFLSFVLFFIMGISSLFQGSVKAFFRTRKKRKLKFEYSGISFVIDVYLDETKADKDDSKLLSFKEAIYLAIALSLDSLVSGFALGICISNITFILCISFCIGVFVIMFGSFLGRRLCTLPTWNLSWCSGILFLILAFSRII